MSKPLKRVLLAFSILFAGLLLACAGIMVAGMRDQLAPADMIVVPGNTIAPDGTPSPRLRARLDAALVQYRAGRVPRIFVSGGTGKEGFDEAASMAAYLRRLGVPAAAIIEDPQGWTTAATARNAGAYLQTHGLHSAMAATQYFHVPRFRLALERQGVAVTGQVHARWFELRDLYSLPRETVAYLIYYLAP